MRIFADDANLVTEPAEALARASRGAAWLDRELGPGWERKINVDRLDIKSPFRCVLAQLCWKGVGLFLPRLSVPEYISHGFSCGRLTDSLVHAFPMPDAMRSYELLNQAWASVIIARRLRARPKRVLRRTRWDPVAVARRSAQPIAEHAAGPNQYGAESEEEMFAATAR